MDKDLEKIIKEMENAGLDVVVTTNQKLSYCTGGVNQSSKYCDSCSSLKFKPDPDENDWFRDDNQKAVCMKMRAAIATGLEHRELTNISKPIWCPNLGRELTEVERQIFDLRLANAKSDF